MRLVSQNTTRSMSSRLSICVKTACLCAALNFGASLGASAAPVSSNSAPPSLVAEVIKLRKAKIAPSVIKAYVENSPLRANLSADQIIALKKASVPAEVIKAIIERGKPQISAEPVLPQRPSPASPSPSPPRSQSAYAARSPGRSNPPYPAVGAAIASPDYLPFVFPVAPPPVLYGALFSFNNSFPTYVNGYPQYSGVGLAPLSGPVTFNNSFPTYVNGYPVYTGSFVPWPGYSW